MGFCSTAQPPGRRIRPNSALSGDFASVEHQKKKNGRIATFTISRFLCISLIHVLIHFPSMNEITSSVDELPSSSISRSHREDAVISFPIIHKRGWPLNLGPSLCLCTQVSVFMLNASHTNHSRPSPYPLHPVHAIPQETGHNYQAVPFR